MKFSKKLEFSIKDKRSFGLAILQILAGLLMFLVEKNVPLLIIFLILGFLFLFSSFSNK